MDSIFQGKHDIFILDVGAGTGLVGKEVPCITNDNELQNVIPFIAETVKIKNVYHAA